MNGIDGIVLFFMILTLFLISVCIFVGWCGMKSNGNPSSKEVVAQTKPSISLPEVHDYMSGRTSSCSKRKTIATK